MNISLSVLPKPVTNNSGFEEVGMLKYFVSEEERKASHSTCYFEFQQGYYHGQCWLSNSLCISDTLWDKFDLSKLFERVIGEFDYYGTTVVTKEQWYDIVKISQDSHSSWCEIITEAIPWADRCLKVHEVFTILGI